MGRWSPEISLPAEYSPGPLCSDLRCPGPSPPPSTPQLMAGLCLGHPFGQAFPRAKEPLRSLPAPFRAGAALVLWSLLHPLPSGPTGVPPPRRLDFSWPPQALSTSQGYSLDLIGEPKQVHRSPAVSMASSWCPQGPPSPLLPLPSQTNPLRPPSALGVLTELAAVCPLPSA